MLWMIKYQFCILDILLIFFLFYIKKKHKNIEKIITDSYGFGQVGFALGLNANIAFILKSYLSNV